MKKINKKPVRVFIGIVITLLILITLLLCINGNVVLSLQQFFGFNKEKQLSQGINYQIYKFQNGTGKMLITFKDDENGIASISLNNENEIKASKNTVSIDYDFNYNDNYMFKMTTKNGRELTENVTIDDEFLWNNGIKMENTKPDTYNYKVIQLTLSLLENVNYKKQYKVEDGKWMTCEDSFSVFDFDVKDFADENDEVRIYVRAINTSNENEVVEVSKKFKVNVNATTSTIEADSILAAVADDEFITGRYKLKVNDETYAVHAYEQEGSQVWTTNMTFGTEDDIGTKTSYAQNMVIVKVNGDLTIEKGVTVGPYYTEYGGPKGFLLYVTGKLTNKGTIDNSHGAYAEGQNVYMWKNEDESYEYVPAVGGAGAPANPGYSGTIWVNGKDAPTATGRKTGGGSSAAGFSSGGAAGTAGTSYSGGTGSGSCSGGAGTPNGGPGGNGNGLGSGGSGNPGGAKGRFDYPNGSNGTGGLLIIYADEYKNDGSITAIGRASGTGGSSGGGSINIFTNQSMIVDQLGIVTNAKYNEILGSYNILGGRSTDGTRGGYGGTGTINIGEIRNGTYYDLKTCIDQDKETFITSNAKQGDSILSILEDNSLTSGYYYFETNGETYSVHLYVLDGNQTFTTDQAFGDQNDISRDIAATSTDAAYRAYAQNMVIVKVKGDLTINEGVTVGPYYTEYGGPKGFLLYVTGKLTNNGTIDNSHGAYAEGQNVYMWKNTDESYEYVPAVGGAGAQANPGYAGTIWVNGKDAPAATERKTGGGSSAAGFSSGGAAGTAGTSYSGGTGSGSCSGGAGTPNGGAGGNGNGLGSGGSGNPGGAKGRSDYPNGSNGTGGLLIIYADEYENNGNITAIGRASGTGGSSGGGSINIFTNQSTGVDQLGIVTNARYNEILGSYNILGGRSTDGTRGGYGGTGTINIGEIRNGTYYDLKTCIDQDNEEYMNSSARQGDSILSILDDDSLTSGYYYFRTNEEMYFVHLYVIDGNQTFTTNQTFGDGYDISRNISATSTDAAYRAYAQNMVIVKIKGDLTIDEGVTVGPYYTEYGGPKGFLLYVTGKLTNNGTIDNSHGAYAQGQDVYMWKNTDESYEYVPAVGGAGAQANPGYSGTIWVEGKNAPTASGRQTGGGGSAAGYYGGAQAGRAGTSYSGGTGSGANGYSGNSEGGAGGSSGNAADREGGAGNPGGTGKPKGANGTGGLLIIYANEFENNTNITATGVSSGTGGGSGGGSVNIFYNSLIKKGTINVNGGRTTTGIKGGAGGTGTATLGNISTGTFVKDTN